MAECVFFGEGAGAGEQSLCPPPSGSRGVPLRFGGSAPSTEQEKGGQGLVGPVGIRPFRAVKMTRSWVKKASVVLAGGTGLLAAGSAARLTLTCTSRSLRCGGFGTGDCISAFRLRISEGLAEEASLQATVTR